DEQCELRGATPRAMPSVRPSTLGAVRDTDPGALPPSSAKSADSNPAASPNSGTIRGFITEEGGRPVANVLVQLRPEGEETPVDVRMLKLDQRTDEVGHFEFRKLPEGKRFLVMANAEGYVQAQLSQIKAVPPVAAPDTILRLKKGWWLTGSVTDPAGIPIKRARIQVRHGTQLYYAVSGDNGKFRVDGISPERDDGRPTSTIEELTCSANHHAS